MWCWLFHTETVLSFIYPATFGIQLWGFGTYTYLVRDIDAQESVQQFAARVCLKQWHLEYAVMLSLLHIHSISSRKLMCLLLKIVRKQSTFHDPLFHFRTATIASHSTTPFTFARPFGNHNYYLYSYFPSTISIWNSLPFDITAPPFNSFNSALVYYNYV